MKKLLIGLLALASISSFAGAFAQNADSGNSFDNLFKEAEEAFNKSPYILEAPTNNDLENVSFLSENELDCLSLTSLQVRLKTKSVKKAVKMKARKGLLKKISDRKYILGCDH